MWEKVAARTHSPLKIFPAGAAGADEVMLYGTVAYTLKDGRQAGVDWAARANLVKSGDDGKVRMRYYQVYLVSVFFFLFFSSLGFALGSLRGFLVFGVGVMVRWERRMKEGIVV